MPLLLADDKSTLSKPIPTLDINFSFGADSRTRSVIGSVPAMTASYSPIIDAALSMDIKNSKEAIENISLINAILNSIGYYTGLNELISSGNGIYKSLSLEMIFGYLFSPIAWLIGIPFEDILLAGQLLGEKTVANEFIAYESLGTMIKNNLIGEKTRIMATYFLCGFANFLSIGIQIGGIGAIAPDRRSDLAKLGIKALIAGTIASLLTAVIVGTLI